MPGLRILLLADSHLGFDLPVRSRVARRRRGDDFLANYRLGLQPALAGEVDIVVHGGDVFDHPHASADLAYQAYAPLVEIARRGIPVFIVPGNHERARLPHSRFLDHPGIHVFDRPRTFAVDVRGTRVALAGFPYERRDVRARFPQILEATGWRAQHADTRLLCFHHCAEGARVGPGDFMFTRARNVVRLRDIPRAFAAAFSGHIHRQQVLTRDLYGTPVETPVIYPGSIERTALAEQHEAKSYTIVHVSAERVRCELRELPARPMLLTRIGANGLNAAALDAALRRAIAGAPRDAVLTVVVGGSVAADARRAERRASATPGVAAEALPLFESANALAANGAL